jgi:hypothetical protein
MPKINLQLWRIIGLISLMVPATFFLAKSSRQTLTPPRSLPVGRLLPGIARCCRRWVLNSGAPGVWFSAHTHEGLKGVAQNIPFYTLKEQLATGTVLVHSPQAPAVMAVALYARVASADQQSDLERQLGRLAEYASRENLTVVRSVSEIGSGLNGHRAKVMRLLADPSVHTVVVNPRPPRSLWPRR